MKSSVSLPIWLPESLLGSIALLLTLGIVLLSIDSWRSWRPHQVSEPARVEIPFEDCAPIWDAWRRWVVQEDGRIKPFDTFCRETVRAICGRESLGEVRSRTTGAVLIRGHDPVAVIVSWMLLRPGDPRCDWESHPFLYCPDSELRQLLHEEPQGLTVAPATVRSSPEFAKIQESLKVRPYSGDQVPLSLLEKACLELQGRLDLYDRVCRGGEVEDGRECPHMRGDMLFAPLDSASNTWFGLNSLRHFAESPSAWEAASRRRRLEGVADWETPIATLPKDRLRSLIEAFERVRHQYSLEDPVAFEMATRNFVEICNNGNSSYLAQDLVEREVWFHQIVPFRRAWVWGALAALCCAGGLLFSVRWKWLGRILYGFGLLGVLSMLGWAGVGFFCRVTLSGRPPVSNMYESIIWVAWMVGIGALLLEAFSRRRLIVLVGAIVATLGFIVADGLPLTFSPAIQPLQAVLRSNTWLVIHVLTIVSSYAPLALAWGLGNMNLALILFAPGRRDLIRTVSGFCYRAIQAGVLLLFLGTMLGGFWAAESWGRFWGWDPKEVWALIAFLCYIIPLHARYVGWVGDFGLAAYSVVCFASVVMAWYGVNFVLGAGLHSYGFGSGDHSAVYLVGMWNLNLVVLAALRYRRNNLSPSPFRAIAMRPKIGRVDDPSKTSE